MIAQKAAFALHFERPRRPFPHDESTDATSRPTVTVVTVVAATVVAVVVTTVAV